MHPEKVVFRKFIKKKKGPVATNSPMLHTRLEQIAHWHFFVHHSYVAASAPRPGCHSGKGSGHHWVPSSHAEVLHTLQQLTFTGIMHKRLLEQQQRHNMCFPRTGHSNACNACPAITNQKCPSESTRTVALVCLAYKQTKEITMATYPGSKMDGSELPGYISPG